nr:ATP-binding cassette domain-containing protein [Providencia sp. G1(2023)]
MNHFADQPFNRLSGGEKQMVMIARALASEPEILILDEPTSALDLANQDNVLSVLRDLAAHRGMTILFTSHYPQHALHIADHSLLLFNNGSFFIWRFSNHSNGRKPRKALPITGGYNGY